MGWWVDTLPCWSLVKVFRRSGHLKHAAADVAHMVTKNKNTTANTNSAVCLRITGSSLMCVFGLLLPRSGVWPSLRRLAWVKFDRFARSHRFICLGKKHKQTCRILWHDGIEETIDVQFYTIAEERGKWGSSSSSFYCNHYKSSQWSNAGRVIHVKETSSKRRSSVRIWECSNFPANLQMSNKFLQNSPS